MHLIVVTQKVDANDCNLGFFLRWIEELSSNVEVTVIANEVGEHQLQGRVKVFSLEKERGVSRLARFLRYRVLLREHLPSSNGIFFHMCPEYVIAALELPKRFGNRSLLWYVHKQVSLRLRLAARMVDKIFTASKESCRLRSGKIEVVGHGIYVPIGEPRSVTVSGLHLVTVGRISPVKDLSTLISGFFELRKQFPEAQFSIFGKPITDSDGRYLDSLRKQFPDPAIFKGASRYGETFLSQTYTVFVHASRTGSVDKAVLEALAAGLPVITSSEAFNESIPGIHKFQEGNPTDFAKQISRLFLQGKLVIRNEGREYVKKHHDLKRLIQKITTYYEAKDI